VAPAATANAVTAPDGEAILPGRVKIAAILDPVWERRPSRPRRIVMVSEKRRALPRWMALAAVLLGAEGCWGGADAGEAVSVAQPSLGTTLVAGEVRPDGLRAYWRFTDEGACIVRAGDVASAQTARCVELPREALRDGRAPRLDAFSGAGGFASSVELLGEKSLREGGHTPKLHLSVEDSTSSASIGIGTGGR
jgi:hypothetical protein